MNAIEGIRGNPIVNVSDATLRSWPLPLPDGDGDKESRGRVLVVAGSREMPGAAILAGMAALRAGAGKLVIATAASAALGVALGVPEARVIALPETEAGGLQANQLLIDIARTVSAVLIGPGMIDKAATCALVLSLLHALRETPLILDALAMKVLATPKRVKQPILITPHAGEMAALCGADKAAVQADAMRTAYDAARNWNVAIALKGASTCIATADGRLWRHEGGNIGLATSGSGDVLAGVIAGLAARGATLEQAAVWGVALHSRAGNALAAWQGSLGYLAREIAAEIPVVMHAAGVHE